MKHLNYILTLVCLMGLALPAQASFSFVDRPPSMALEYPDSIECQPVRYPAGIPGVFGADCAKRLEGLNGMMEILVENPETGQQGVQRMPTTQPIQCMSNYCKVRRTKELAGYNYGDVKWDFKVPYGWYVIISQDNTVTMHRRGTGPKGDQLTQYVVLSEQNQRRTTGATDTYNVYCSPQSDTCLYTDGQGQDYDIPRDELNTIIPYAENTQDCIRTFCYNANQDVIGLNPNW